MQLLAEPLLNRLAAATQAHLAGQHGHQYVGRVDERELAAALLPAVAAHTAEVLGMLGAQHEARAAAFIGDSRAVNTLRAAHQDAAQTVRNLAELYAAGTKEDPR